MASSSLFRDFSFDAAATSPHHHEADRAAMNVSPTSILAHPHPLPMPPPPSCSIGDLASKLDHHHLHVDVEVDPSHQWPSTAPSSAPSSDNLSLAVHQLDSSPQRPYSRISSAVLRMQRQSNTRLHCSSSHVKSISKLVERMVDDETQCHIHDPQSPSISSTSSGSSASEEEEDEAIDMDYSPESFPLSSLSFRRSSDRSHGSASVTRSVRMRCKSRITKRASR